MDNPEYWDLFICHASEDKEEIARSLAHLLRAAGLNVWYDEFSLKLGDSLKESIERGLRGSRYGLVILSPNFFGRSWPEKELSTLISLQKSILPIWHEIDKEQIDQFSPILSDIVAEKTSEGLEKVVNSILSVFHPLVEDITYNDLLEVAQRSLGYELR